MKTAIFFVLLWLFSGRGYAQRVEQEKKEKLPLKVQLNGGIFGRIFPTNQVYQGFAFVTVPSRMWVDVPLNAERTLQAVGGVLGATLFWPRYRMGFHYSAHLHYNQVKFGYKNASDSSYGEKYHIRDFLVDHNFGWHGYFRRVGRPVSQWRYAGLGYTILNAGYVIDFVNGPSPGSFSLEVRAYTAYFGIPIAGRVNFEAQALYAHRFPYEGVRHPFMFNFRLLYNWPRLTNRAPDAPSGG